jgi:hypothetical protein
VNCIEKTSSCKGFLRKKWTFIVYRLGLANARLHYWTTYLEPYRQRLLREVKIVLQSPNAHGIGEELFVPSVWNERLFTLSVAG